MFDFSAIALLLTVNAYLALALMLFGFSARSLACLFLDNTRSVKRYRGIKAFVALLLILSCLALLAAGLFAVGMAHGSRPENYEVMLFVAGCLLPVLLLVIWVVGSLWLDALWVVLVAALLGYLLIFNPAIYVQYWADSNNQYAQMWMARNYAAGQGGLKQSDSTARRWYKLAALNGNSDAQYQLASAARRNREALKWYLLAAEQGHVGAMVQMARLSRSDADREYWLTKAVDKQHPEAVFMLAEKMQATDLSAARSLLLEAAESGSRTAIVFLIAEYRQGGLLFELDDDSAGHWLAVLEITPVGRFEPVHLSAAAIELILTRSQVVGDKVRAGDVVTLYQQARMFLRHPAKDQALHARAIAYLKRAAKLGHSESALELAQLAISSDKSAQLNDEAIKWYEVAANSNNVKALERLTRFYKSQKEPTQAALQKSLEYNQRLLAFLGKKTSSKQRLALQYWASEYRDSQKRLAQLIRLGGSWQSAAEQALDNPQKEYLLAKELLSNGDYAAGMQHLKSAAQRNNSAARFELAQKTLRGPRSFSQEILAVSEIQALDRLGYLAASMSLGTLYQSGTGIVPRNYYLSGQLLRKAQVDSQFSEQAGRWLKRIPGFIDSLELNSTHGLKGQLESWYLQAATEVEDGELLRQQYEALQQHFSVVEGKGASEESDAIAQYQLAQTMQSHNLEQAVVWLRRAAAQGEANAQYELAVRMIRGKKNTPEQKRELVLWANTAANSGHVGALVFLASQHKNGYGGFKKSSSLAIDYYQQALSSTDAEVLYQGKIAGRDITIRRSNIKKALASLQK